MPPVRVKDNIGLRSREYVIQLRGTEISRFELLQGHELAISSGNPDAAVSAPDAGRKTRGKAGRCPSSRRREARPGLDDLEPGRCRP